MSTMPEPDPISGGAWQRLLLNCTGKDGGGGLFKTCRWDFIFVCWVC